MGLRRTIRYYGPLPIPASSAVRSSLLHQLTGTIDLVRVSVFQTFNGKKLFKLGWHKKGELTRDGELHFLMMIAISSRSLRRGARVPGLLDHGTPLYLWRELALVNFTRKSTGSPHLGSNFPLKVAK
jgi:hypothetical protein